MTLTDKNGDISQTSMNFSISSARLSSRRNPRPALLREAPQILTTHQDESTCSPTNTTGLDADARPGLVRRLVGLSPDEASFQKRGFQAMDPERQDRLEAVGKAFIHGYNTALSVRDLSVLRSVLDAAPLDKRGFVYEGAGMGAAILDALPFADGKHFAALLADCGDEHAYLLHVGAGWAMARLPWRRKKILANLEPLLAWLAFDGQGFHDVYFKPHRLDRGLPGNAGYQRRAWDQGAGRSLWFVSGGSIAAALRLILDQSERRRADLLSGLALAVTYTGGAGARELDQLVASAGEHRAHVAQGAAFAIEARYRGENPLGTSEGACRILTGLDPETVLGIVWTDRPSATQSAATDAQDGEPAYEHWRASVRGSIVARQQEGLRS